MPVPGRPRRILAAFRRHPILTCLLLFLVGFPLWSTYGQDCRTGVLHFRSSVPIAELRVDVHPSVAQRMLDPGPNRTIWRGRPSAGEPTRIPYAGNIYSAIRTVMRTQDGRIVVEQAATSVMFYGEDSYVTFDGRQLHKEYGRPSDWPFDMRGWLNDLLSGTAWGLFGASAIGDALSCADEDAAHGVL